MYGDKFMKFLDDIRDLGLEELQERNDAMRAAAKFDMQGNIDSAEADPDQPE